MTEDFYTILEIDRNASEEEIRAAYRKKILQMHPDRLHVVLEENTKKLNEAYSTLTTNREYYDRHLPQHNQKKKEPAWKPDHDPTTIEEYFEMINNIEIDQDWYSWDNCFLDTIYRNYKKYGKKIKVSYKQAEQLERITGYEYPGDYW